MFLEESSDLLLLQIRLCSLHNITFTCTSRTYPAEPPPQQVAQAMLGY